SAPRRSLTSSSPATATSRRRRTSAAPTTSSANLLNSPISFAWSKNMQLKAELPPECPAGSDPVERLMGRLAEEGFTTDLSREDWEQYGEIIFHRDEKISFAEGETVFIFTRVDELAEGSLKQSSEKLVRT